MQTWAALCLAGLAGLALAGAGAAASKDDAGNKVARAVPFREMGKDRTRVGIINGGVSLPGRYPYTAAIFPNFSSFCGGSLINTQWVLTAGHCVASMNYWIIYLGAQNMMLPKESNRKAYVTPYSWINPNYDFPSNDVALLQLVNPVVLTDSITPVALSTIDSSQLMNQAAIVTGWGYIDNTIQVISPELRYASLTVTAMSECNSFYNATYGEGILCVKGLSGQSICEGDSGSPLVYTKQDGSLAQIGVASFSPSSQEGGCEGNAPNGFADVQHYVSWIEETTGVQFH